MGHKRAKSLLPNANFFKSNKKAEDPAQGVESNLKVPFEYQSKQNSSINHAGETINE